MTYQTQHLETIANTARTIMGLTNVDKDEAVEQAINVVGQTASDALKRTGPHEQTMLAEQKDEYRYLAGVVEDVKNGFVSPTLGNVKDYLKTLV